MNEDLKLRIKAVSLYSHVAEHAAPLIELSGIDGAGARLECAARVFSAVADSGCDTTGEWLCKLVASDDNAFSRAAAKGERISPRIKAQVESELLAFKQLSMLNPDDFCTDATRAVFPRFGFGGFNATFDKLSSFYRENGCGLLSTASAFSYSGGEFRAMPVEPVRLSDLKNYAEEKAEIVKNTENFIAGFPAFHTLLYGDRGTGKSTTVRALGYEYRDRLKIIEVPKSELGALGRLYEKLDGFCQKFIIFVDDLSFEEGDGGAEAFKAALEGSLSRSDNALLYCTSNRRHLIKETEREVKNRNDETQAELALFDRFGLVVTYVNPDKAEYLDIFKQILRSRGIKWRDEYAQVAELAALKKGGRSPRAAKQIADLIETTFSEAEKKK